MNYFCLSERFYLFSQVIYALGFFLPQKNKRCAIYHFASTIRGYDVKYTEGINGRFELYTDQAPWTVEATRVEHP